MLGHVGLWLFDLIWLSRPSLVQHQGSGNAKGVAGQDARHGPCNPVLDGFGTKTFETISTTSWFSVLSALLCQKENRGYMGTPKIREINET